MKLSAFNFRNLVFTVLSLNLLALQAAFAECPRRPDPKCETTSGWYLSNYAGQYFSKVMNPPVCVPVLSKSGLSIVGYNETYGGPIVVLGHCINSQKVTFYAKETTYRAATAGLAVNAYNTYLVEVALCNVDAGTDGVEVGADCSKNAKSKGINKVS